MRVRDELKEAAIRKKAIYMIVKEGFDGLSMQKLAKAADVSPATIYIYFKDREDLIVELWRREMDQMFEATLEGFDAEMSFEDGLRHQWMNRARYFMMHQDVMHFMEQIKYSPYESLCRRKMNSNFIEVMTRFTTNAIKRKELVSLPLEVFWSVAYAPLYQLVKFHMSGRGLGHNDRFTLDERTMEQTLQLVLKALRPEPKRK